MTKVRSLNANLQQIATTELNEDPAQIDDEIETTLQLIDIQPGLARYDVSDQFILSFLRSCKYNPRTVKKKLPNYISMRKISPDIFANRIVNAQLIDIIQKGVHLPLPQALETNSSLINISNYGNLNLKQFSIYDGIKLLYMMLEVRFLEDDRSSVAGFTFIEDFSDLSFSHMVAMNIGVLKKIMGYMRSGMPYRVKGIHIINAPWFVNGIMGLFRDILPLKIKKRFFIHKKVTELYAHVPQRLLPEEYGGENGSIEDITKTWVAKMQQYGDYFQKDLKFGVDPESGIGSECGVEPESSIDPAIGIETESSIATDGERVIVPSSIKDEASVETAPCIELIETGSNIELQQDLSPDSVVDEVVEKLEKM